MCDFHPWNGDSEFSNAKKWKFGRKLTLETHFQTYWTILEKSIFLAPKIGQNDGFTVKIAASGSLKKRKYRSKNLDFG